MPQISRRDDPNTPHCSGHQMSGGADNWFCEGKPVTLNGDPTTGHLTDEEIPCPGHSSTLSAPDRGWRCEGRTIGAVGDPHCTRIASGAQYWGIE